VRTETKILFENAAHYYPSNVLTLDALAYWIAFSRVIGIGPKRFKSLLDFFQEDVAAAWHASASELKAAGLETKIIESFLRQRATIIPLQELERLQQLRIQVITWKDPTYPPLLRKIEYPPAVLYLCGTLTDDDHQYSLGIVGTRRMTMYGRQVTERFSSGLARGKITIVSGLALGIDTVAHTSALNVAGGRTLAVLASGLDHIYPASNYQLAKRIVESGQGALITTFPLGVKPEAGNFPARNHIISGLSLGIIVTEAPRKSGALLTANSALNQGREVFAVPGAIFSPGGEGVNKLIQDGAHPVTQVKDILEHLNFYMVPQQVEAKAILPTNEEERTLLAHLSHEPRHIDEIIQSSLLNAPEVSALLTIMELKGMIRHVGGMQYVLAH
jgi:DNA processing protein